MQEKNDGTQVTLNQSHMSRIVALLLMGAVFVFVAGYYMGKMSTSDEAAENIERELFADRLYSSLCAVYPLSDSPAAMPVDVGTGLPQQEK